MSGLRGRKATLQDLQFLADVALEDSFARNDPRTVEGPSQATPTPETFNYLRSVPEVNKAVKNAVNPHQISVSVDQMTAYGWRVLRPGTVQSFGVLVFISKGLAPAETAVAGSVDSFHPRGLVLATSANAKQVLGVEASELLETNLFDPAVSPFDVESLAALEEMLERPELSSQVPLLASLSRVGSGEGKAFLIVNETDAGYVIDVDPLTEDTSHLLQGSIRTHSLAKQAVEQMQQLSSKPVEEQCQALCDEIRALTGYDRVMVYKFHPDCHGEVVSESVSEHVKVPMFGLHFPATDIPQVNRLLFLTLRSRLIADTSASNVDIIQSPKLADRINIGASQLRGVSGCHNLYLQNMGSTATLVMSIVTGPDDDGIQLTPDFASMNTPLHYRRKKQRGAATTSLAALGIGMLPPHPGALPPKLQPQGCNGVPGQGILPAARPQTRCHGHPRPGEG